MGILRKILVCDEAWRVIIFKGHPMFPFGIKSQASHGLCEVTSSLVKVLSLWVNCVSGIWVLLKKTREDAMY